MNKLEYIPGDLVKIEYGEATGKIGFVTNTFLRRKGCYSLVVFIGKEFQGSSKDDWIQTYNDEVSPIPLTTEILEKNGWNKEEKDGSVFSLSEAFMGGDENDEDNYTCFQLYYQNKKDGWVIDMRGEPLKFGIHYIHELQNLFFGLGLSHEMEV